MAQLGLDPEQMRVLQKSLQREDGTIRALAKQLDGQLKSAWWKGQDSDRFRSEWDGAHRAQLEKVSAALEAASKTVAANIAQQNQASQS